MEMPASSLTGLTLKDLLDAGLHFGHQTKRWNPKMKRYIFDKRNGIHIVDLTQTVSLLDAAAAFLRDTVANGGKVLFVATKKQAQDVVREAAIACDQYYVTERWLGGTLTNNETIRRSVKRMRQIETMARNNNGVLSEHKKEASNLRRELDKLQRNLSGVADMSRLPSAMFVIDLCREENAVNEACRLGIPVVAIVDTNVDPDPVDYVIPGNDDAIRGIKLIADAFARVIKEASDEYAKVAAEKNRQAEAERAAQDAQERAAGGGARGGRQRRERDGADASANAREKLAKTRRSAAKAAQEAVAAQVAAVEAVTAEAAPVEAAPAEAVVVEAAPVETVVAEAAPVETPVVESAPAAAATDDVAQAEG